MPHVRIGYPHRAKDGTKRVQGDIVYLTSAEARAVVADGKGTIVQPSPEEVVKLAGKKVPAKPAQEPREQDKPEPSKDEPKPKLPARKPADG